MTPKQQEGDTRTVAVPPPSGPVPESTIRIGFHSSVTEADWVTTGLPGDSMWTNVSFEALQIMGIEHARIESVPSPRDRIHAIRARLANRPGSKDPDTSEHAASARSEYEVAQVLQVRTFEEFPS